MTLREAVKGAKDFDSSHSEVIRTFGWFLHMHKDRKRFSTDDLRNCYGELSMAAPGSFNPWFKRLQEQGDLLKDAGGYYLERKAMERLTAKLAPATATVQISEVLLALPTRITEGAERLFIEEAIRCIRASAPRAAIVIGWCAVIDRMRRKVEAVGFDKFNATSTALKNATTGKFKSWNKGLQAQSSHDLLSIFDTDLIVILEGMRLIDGNQADRLRMLFTWRCQSAHPADAPIKETHVIAFFSDAVDLVLANPQFAL